MWLVKHVAGRSRSSDWRGYFLIACVVVLALLLAGASWSASLSSDERTAAEKRQVHTLEVLLETDALRTATLQQVRGERGFLLTGNEEFLKPYSEGSAQAQASFDTLRHLTADNSEQQRTLNSISTAMDELKAVFSAMIDQQRAGRHVDAVRYVRRGNGRNAIENILAELDELEQVERGILAERTAVAQTSAVANERYQYLLTAIGLMLIVLALTATLFVRRAMDAEAEVRRELQRHATTDALTALANRRSFMEALGRSIARASSDKDRTLSLAIFDIDHFKRINDRFGHPAGDEVIRAVAGRALDSLRARDLVGRIGGEEFAVILPKADLEIASAVCERLREAIAGKPVVHGNAIIPFTASVGIAEFSSGDDIDRFMARADAALYEAKTGGRNQVRLAA